MGFIRKLCASCMLVLPLEIHVFRHVNQEIFLIWTKCGTRFNFFSTLSKRVSHNKNSLQICGSVILQSGKVS